MDRSGNVVGVVRAKLGMKLALKTGDLPQNNFSIKATTLMNVLEANGVGYSTAASARPWTARPCRGRKEDERIHPL